MSHLPPQAVKEFQTLYRKHVGEDLPDERAPDVANRVFNVLRIAIEQQAAQQASQAGPVGDALPAHDDTDAHT